MKSRRIVRRSRARRDFDDAVDHYLEEASVEVALRLVDSIENAFDHLATYPAIGSPRYSHQLDIPGLRTWPLADFPYLIFYVEKGATLEILRILHGSRDIPATLDPRGTVNLGTP